MGRSRKTIRKVRKNSLKPGAFSPNPNRQHMQRQPGKDNAIAYCHHRQHIGYLNASMIKQHECLKKGCRFLEKYETKYYWISREIKSVLKKYHKNSNSGFIVINGVKYKSDNERNLCSICMEFIGKTGNKPDIYYEPIEKGENFMSDIHENDVKKTDEGIYLTEEAYADLCLRAKNYESFKEKAKIVIEQLREERDYLRATIENIKKQLETKEDDELEKLIDDIQEDGICQ